MDGGNVDIHVNVDPSGTRRGVAAAKQEIRGLQQEAQQSGIVIDRAFAGAALRAGGAGLAVFALTQNVEHLGIEGKRAAGFLQSLGNLDVIGAVQAAQQVVKLTADQITKMGTDTSITTDELWKMTAALDALGNSEAAAKIRAIRQEMIALAALEFAGRGFNMTVVGGVNAAVARGVRPDDRGGMLGVGGVQAGAAQAGTSSALPDTTGFGMSPRLRTAIAAAYTTPGKGDEIAQLRRARGVLQKQLASGALNTDEARLQVYTELGQVQDELTALTKKTVEKEKKLQFLSIDPASVLGALGQGPFMRSPVMQFAQGFGYQPGAKDYLRDISQQVAQGGALERNLGVLRKRGLGEAAIGELAGMGLGASDQVAALAKASPALVRQYNRQAERREDIAERFQTMTAEIQTANIVIKNGRVIGVDRNGDGTLQPRERFAAEAGGR